MTILPRMMIAIIRKGARVSLLTGHIKPDDFWDKPYQGLGDILPIFSGSDRLRKYELTAGQSIFTPTNVVSATPSPRDRPYAAWLYTGAGLLQETKYQDYHTLENVEILGGIVGPAALGGPTQNTFHQFIGVNSSLGWQNQLHNEPGVILTYERKYRFQQPIYDNLAVDIIPEAGGSGGNILTYAEIGGIMRFGQNLAADYGPEHIRPSVSGTSWFDANQLNGNFGLYGFIGAQGRAVARNIFLDGNSWSASPGVGHKPLVADFTGGVSAFWSTRIRADFTVTQRTKEFDGQRGHPDRFGGVNIAFSF